MCVCVLRDLYIVCVGGGGGEVEGRGSDVFFFFFIKGQFRKIVNLKVKISKSSNLSV